MRWTSLLLLVGCAADGFDADTGAYPLMEEDAAAPAELAVRCNHVYTDVAPELSVQGLRSGDSLVALASGERSAQVRWDHDQRRTELHFELRDPTRYRLGEPTVSDPGCAPHLLVDLTLDLRTADGRLGETLSVTVRGGADDEVRLEHWFPLAALAGAWEPAEIDPAEWDLVDVELVASVGAHALVGELAVYAQRYRSGAPDELIAVDVARWPAD